MIKMLQDGMLNKNASIARVFLFAVFFLSIIAPFNITYALLVPWFFWFRKANNFTVKEAFSSGWFCTMLILGTISYQIVQGLFDFLRNIGLLGRLF